MIRGFLLSLLGALGCICASAQFVSLSDTVSFGLIREADGPVTKRVYVKNVSDSEASILSVRPTCGCTAADFLRSPVAPGDSAWIELTYNPARRPGSFEQAVKVIPVQGEGFKIPITGTVLATAETIETMYPVSAGNLHLSETTIIAPQPLSYHEKALFFDAYNSGETPLVLRLENSDPAINHQVIPEILGQGEKALIAVYVYPLKEERRGPVEYKLLLYPDTADTPAAEPVELTVHATITD